MEPTITKKSQKNPKLTYNTSHCSSIFDLLTFSVLVFSSSWVHDWHISFISSAAFYCFPVLNWRSNISFEIGPTEFLESRNLESFGCSWFYLAWKDLYSACSWQVDENDKKTLLARDQFTICGHTLSYTRDSTQHSIEIKGGIGCEFYHDAHNVSWSKNLHVSFSERDEHLFTWQILIPRLSAEAHTCSYGRFYQKVDLSLKSNWSFPRFVYY